MSKGILLGALKFSTEMVILFMLFLQWFVLIELVDSTICRNFDSSDTTPSGFNMKPKGNLQEIPCMDATRQRRDVELNLHEKYRRLSFLNHVVSFLSGCCWTGRFKWPGMTCHLLCHYMNSHGFTSQMPSHGLKRKLELYVLITSLVRSFLAFKGFPSCFWLLKFLPLTNGSVFSAVSPSISVFGQPIGFNLNPSFSWF